jgi:hypothetical protein
MLQSKPDVKGLVSSPQTFGEKLVTVLRQPLFTIPLSFPVKKKTVPQTTIKIVKPKRAVKQNRPVSAKSKDKSISARNMPSGKNVVSHLFTSSHNRKDFDKILFVLRACDKNTGRAFTNVLHIERAKNGSRLVASDGKRLHVTNIGKRIKPGDYKPLITKNTIKLRMPVPNINFPNWERVVPVNTVRRGSINFENAVIGENSRAYISFTKMSGEKVNPSYLSDLTKKTWVIHSQNEKRKALILKEYGAEDETYAVIMPLSA